MTARVLVAGVGNILLTDDGFGVEVVKRLREETFPEGVRVADYGIRAVHLAYELLEGYDTLVLVDAMSRGERPGTLFVFEPDLTVPDEEASLDPHSLHPGSVLRLAIDLGATLGTVCIVGCEPADLEEGIGLTEPVEQAAGAAVRLVRELVHAATQITNKENAHAVQTTKIPD